jgi:hypothetical protein
MIAKQQALMANHQVMMQAPGELRQKYFDEVYAQSILAATNSHLEEETRQVELRARKASAEKKLAECQTVVEGTKCDNMGIEEIDSDNDSSEESIATKQNVSHWVELARKGEGTVADLLKSCYGSEFACLHNRDSSDFMNESKFKRFILKRTNDDVPFSWDLLDETGRHIVMEIVEDEDQGPSKEWGRLDGIDFQVMSKLKVQCKGSHIEMVLLLGSI